MTSANHATKAHQAARLINQGKLQEAEKIYRKLITDGTNNHIVYGNLAAVCGMQGRFDEVIELLEKALQIAPNHPTTHNNLGNAFKEKGDLNAAIESFKRAIELKPNFPNAHFNLGITLKELGQINAAIASFNRAIKFEPDFPDAHNNLGIALKQLGKIDAAITSFDQALKLKGKYPNAHYNLGLALIQKDDLDSAISSFNKALEIKPDFANAHNSLGLALIQKDDLEAAISFFNQALKIKPDFPAAHNNLGNALKEQGNLSAAIDSFNRALELNPDFPDAHNGLGVALTETSDLNAAIDSFNRALELKPDFPAAHNNLGNALKEQGNINASIACFSKAIELDPTLPEAHFNCSISMLLGGDYNKGWEGYEWLKKTNQGIRQIHAQPNCVQWDLKELKGGSKLLLVTEQGLGDTLQFMRYAIALRHQGISVSLCAQTKLHSLIQTSSIDPSPLTPEQANNISDGQWTPLLSIPKYLGVSPQNPIITQPYIKTTDELNAKWRDTLHSAHKPIIGINWRGNREDISKQNRNIPTQVFRKIIEASASSFLCLQRGAQASEIEQLALNSEMRNKQFEALHIADSDEQEHFLEYAAIVSNCDLVITTGSTVAHIAGGLGIPTWVLLPKIPDWRWGIEGDTTFWYPSMRLFRQRERGNWDEVIERVTTALQDHVENGAK